MSETISVENAKGTDDISQFELTPSAFLDNRRTSELAYVFDLREAELFEQKKFPGSLNLPMEHFQANLHRLPFQGALMFYDGGEGLVLQAAQILFDNGFTEFHFVEGGLTTLLEALENDPKEVVYEKLDTNERAQAIEKALDEKVREFLAKDGGGLEVVGIEDDRVLVSYQGACGGCASSTGGTLRFIESMLTISLNHEIEVVPVD